MDLFSHHSTFIYIPVLHYSLRNQTELPFDLELWEDQQEKYFCASQDQGLKFSGTMPDCRHIRTALIIININLSNNI